MIELLGSKSGGEYLAAEKIKSLFLDIWPQLESSNDVIKIYAGAKIFGYQTQDIDVVVYCLLNSPLSFSPTRPVNVNPDGEIEKRSLTVESFVLCIEVKGHDAKSVKFEGAAAYVRYVRNNSNGWHSASDQSLTQAHSLKQYFFDELKANIYVANLIYFDNLDEHDLPKRPHNIFTSSITPKDFFTVIAENYKPWRRKNGVSAISCSISDISRKIETSKIFKTILPSVLDRKRLDAISLQQGFNPNWIKEVGSRTLLLKGRAGTGKTIALLQLANYLYVNKSSRILILTYNLALVSDVRRVLALLGLPVGLDEGGVTIESCMSFFRKLLKAFCLLPEDANFVDEYRSLISEFGSALSEEIFNQHEIQGVISKFPDFFSYDYVFIDEAQDWFEDEINIIRKIFDYKNLVIADGLDQVVRGSRSSWTIGLKESERSVYLLDKSLRMKGNLTLFANILAENLGLTNWAVKSNQSIRGGQIHIYIGDMWASLISAKEIIESSISQGNKPYDLLMLISPDMAGLFRDTSLLSSFQNLIGCQLFEGYKSDVRKDFKGDLNLIRAFQYDSARGLEGWATLCFGFDEFYLHRFDLSNKVYDSLYDEVLSKDEWVERDINSWLLMVLTRSIDTTFIQIKDPNSLIAKKIRNISLMHPDIFVWRS